LLLLQPIVENALRHGVRGMPGACVHIAARIEGAHVVLTVDDNGRGLASPHREGLGLRTTRARLQGLFGAAQSLVLKPRPEGGTRVEIRLPFRKAAVATAATAVETPAARTGGAA
jgi:LytS/YehU family sensor histidine kinase